MNSRGSQNHPLRQVQLLPVWQKKDLRGTEQGYACQGPHLVMREPRAAPRPPWLPQPGPVPPLPPGTSFLPRAAGAGRDRLSGRLLCGLLPMVSVPGSESENIVLALHAHMWPQLVKWITDTADRHQSWRTGPDSFPVGCRPTPRVPSLCKVTIIHQEKLCSLFIFTCDRTRFAGLTSLSLNRRGQAGLF